jgi:hypothetical protein
MVNFNELESIIKNPCPIFTIELLTEKIILKCELVNGDEIAIQILFINSNMFRATISSEGSTRL